MLAEAYRTLVAPLGLKTFTTIRADGLESIAMAFPNGEPGTYEQYIQRSKVREEDVHGEAQLALDAAEAAVVGPIADPDEDTIQLYRRIAASVPLKGLLPHETLLSHECFPEIGELFDYVQINGDEARRLDSSTDDVDLLALRFRHLLGDHTE